MKLSGGFDSKGEKMTITKIKRIGNTNRFHVYVDEKWYGIFLDETLAFYHIKTGMSVDEHEFEKIKQGNDKKVSFDMAVSYLEKYVVSEKGLREYLKKKGFDVFVIKSTIEKLEEYGMIDDERFAKNYFDSLHSTKGKMAIANKLKQKGISNEIIENLLADIDEEDEVQKATIIANKFVKNRQINPNLKQKCLAHLIYKGYDYGVAQKATKNALENEGENDDWF